MKFALIAALLWWSLRRREGLGSSVPITIVLVKRRKRLLHGDVALEQSALLAKKQGEKRVKNEVR